MIELILIGVCFLFQGLFTLCLFYVSVYVFFNIVILYAVLMYLLYINRERFCWLFYLNPIYIVAVCVCVYFSLVILLSFISNLFYITANVF